MDSLLRNAISGKGAMRARKGKEGGVLPLLALPLMMKVLGKWVTLPAKGVTGLNQLRT